MNFYSWTPGAPGSPLTYPNQTPAATTGSGTGMVATITVNEFGSPHATITNPGAGYQIGDVISFTPPDGIGSPLDVQVKPVVAQDALPSPFTAWTAGQVYPVVPQAASSGNGAG